MVSLFLHLDYRQIFFLMPIYNEAMLSNELKGRRRDRTPNDKESTKMSSKRELKVDFRKRIKKTRFVNLQSI